MWHQGAGGSNVETWCDGGDGLVDISEGREGSTLLFSTWERKLTLSPDSEADSSSVRPPCFRFC